MIFILQTPLLGMAFRLASLFACSLCLIHSGSLAQSVCLPSPRLLTTMPMGGRVGSQVEVSISGDNIDEADEIYFSHPGLVGVRKRNGAGEPEPNQFLVTIATNCPPGIYEARVMCRLGMSSSRAFSVDTLPEVTQSSPNTTLAEAMDLNVNSICNAVTTTKAVDHYRFHAEKGQRYSAHCAARGIDSKLDAVLIIADAAGRDLLVERRGGMLDFTAPASGIYVIKVHELTFKGGPAFFYRLALQSLAADAPLPRVASTRSVRSFSWPPAGLPPHQIVDVSSSEREPNDSHRQPHKITLPCDISGSFYPAADVDTFEFIGTQGDVWWLEVASERLGRPTDPSAVLQQVIGEGDEQRFHDVAEFSDIPSPVKPSSNSYAYDGPPYDGGSSDILAKLEIKQDGVHHLQLSDLFGGTRNDDRNVYRLIIRRATPDFALVAWGLHMELRNGDRNALSKPISLRGGTTMALEVVAARRDGFDGAIDLVMQGLPDGVTAQALRIPQGKSRGMMLITAQPDAPRAFADVAFFGKSALDGQPMIRPVQMAAVAWPVTDSWSEIPMPRLVAGLPVSVSGSELAPISIAASVPEGYEAVVGGKLTVPLILTRRIEFSGATLQLKASGDGFEQMPRVDVPLTADRHEVAIDLAALKTPPGDYLIAFYGSAVAKYQLNPSAVPAAQSAHLQAVQNVSVIAAEVQRLVDLAAAAAADVKVQAEQAVADALAKQQAADTAMVEAAEWLKIVSLQATPKDTVDIVISEPIAIRVKPVEPQ